MTVFYRIYQKIKTDTTNDELIDSDCITLGYVDNEFFAIEFCNAHKNCGYELIICTNYAKQLIANMVK